MSAAKKDTLIRNGLTAAERDLVNREVEHKPCRNSKIKKNRTVHNSKGGISNVEPDTQANTVRNEPQVTIIGDDESVRTTTIWELVANHIIGPKIQALPPWKRRTPSKKKRTTQHTYARTKTLKLAR